MADHCTFLSRNGFRNGFDQKRQSGEAAWNLGLLCGQSARDPRFEGQPTVTGSDNAARHASRVDPEPVAQILWIVACHGGLHRLYDWARRATEQELSPAVWEGLRALLPATPTNIPGSCRYSFPANA